nr:uncharacterized protein LOC110380982 [Helicoverpa armigera]
MEAQTQNESTKETFKYVNVSQRTRMSRNNSKERICTVIHPNPNYSDHMRGKSNSRLPRIVRTTSKLKPTDTSPKMIEDSGDSPPGPSKLTGFTVKMKKEDIPENLKTSHIPRRKSIKEGMKGSNDCIMKNQTVTNNQFIPETKNVQRVNMLINPEFCSEERVPASKQSTRPIPTLGQIYGRVNMIDSDRLNDWFMELNTPMNSIASNPRPASYGVGHEYNDCISSTEASPAHCHQSDLQRSTIVLDRKNNLMNGFKPANDTVSTWMPSEMEFPTRDNESGYKTMSSKNQPKSIQPQYVSKQVDSQPVKPNNTYCIGLDSYDSSKTSSMLGQSNECSTATSSLLKEQQTVVLCQTPEVKQKVEEGTNVSRNSVDLKPTRISKNEEDKSYHYPSHVVQNTDIRQHRAPVPSYTECLSEILQKTTNFEIMEGIESPKTPSSAGATDIEYRDNLSTDGNMDALDDFTAAEEQSAQEWRRPPFHSNANMTFVKSDDTATNWSCRYRSETSDGCLDDHHHHDSYQLRHEYYKKFYDDSHNDSRGRCKKCQGFKRFPSSRYNLPRTFGSWRQRLSIRRICRRRWNHVWKKTAERWASWSRYTRPPAKFRRFRVMHYLQRSLVWEDADVQTNIHVYHERGIGSSVKEQRSAAIGTVFNMETWNAIANRTDSAVGTMSNNTRIRHVNLGPSMFPFLYNNSKRKPAPLQTVDKTQSPYFQDMDSSVSGNTLNDNFAWNDGDVCNCNSIRSCQFQVTDPMPETVEQATSLSESDDSNLADELTDTMGLSYSMSDKVTSTVVKFNPRWLGKRPGEAITCHNAETEVTFLPMFGNSSTGTITSGGDITFYRPLAGTDISHLITETRTQQALYPILRKFNSNGPTLMTRERSTETAAQTQISGFVPEKVSTGTVTFNPVLTENATSYTPTVLTPPRKTSTEKAYAECKVQTDIPKISEPKSVSTSIGKVLPEKAEFTMQTELSKPVPKSDLETQMSPVHSHSVSTYTHSYPLFGNRQSAFISACVLVNNEEDKESFAVETQSKMPPALAYAGTNIVSISSRHLAGAKGDISKTEMKSDKPRPGSSKLKPRLIRKPPPITTCGTDAMGFSPSETVTQSSSTRGLDSYYETEILLNNLIKKALIGDSSHHSRYSSERSGSQQLMCVTTYTNTHVGLETRGIGPTASDISKLTGIDKTDTSVQYMEDGEGKEQNTIVKEAVECGTGGDWTDSLQAQKPLHHCASVMTAYCGHAEAVQVSSAQATTTDEGNDPEYIVTENIAQPSILKTLHPTEEAKSCSKISNRKSKSKVEFQDDSTHHIISLPRIFGKKKSLTPVKLPPSPTFSTPLCKDSITAEQWINACPSKEKTYESLLMSKDEEENEQIHINSSKLELEESPIIIPMGKFILLQLISFSNTVFL